MLYIEVKTGFGTDQDFEWHIGEPVPQNIPRVVRLQADGDELEMILRAMHETRNFREYKSKFCTP